MELPGPAPRVIRPHKGASLHKYLFFNVVTGFLASSPP